MGDGVKRPSKETEIAESEIKSQSETFRAVFPHYLAMGMSAEEFWDGESWLAVAYRKAFKIRMDNEKAHWEEINDRAAWMQGAYMRRALSSVALLVNGFMPKGVHPEDYPEKPYSEKAREEKNAETKRRKEENAMKLAMAMMQARVAQFNKRFEKKQESEKLYGG